MNLLDTWVDWMLLSGWMLLSVSIELFNTWRFWCSNQGLGPLEPFFCLINSIINTTERIRKIKDVALKTEVITINLWSFFVA